MYSPVQQLDILLFGFLTQARQLCKQSVPPRSQKQPIFSKFHIKSIY